MDVTFTSDDGIGNDRDVRCEAIIRMNESIERIIPFTLVFLFCLIRIQVVPLFVPSCLNYLYVRLVDD